MHIRTLYFPEMGWRAIHLPSIILTLVFSVLVWGAADAQGTQSRPYVLNPGDVLEISVWREKDLTRKVLVLPDGRISFPLAGHIAAAGKSAQQIEEILKQKLARFIEKPVVTVTVTETPGNRIYVIGQVKKPGAYSVARPITVLQALSLAGGLTPFGDASDIIIIRTVNGKQTKIPFDYSKAKRGKALEQNITLQSGDVVVVPE